MNARIRPAAPSALVTCLAIALAIALPAIGISACASSATVADDSARAEEASAPISASATTGASADKGGATGAPPPSGTPSTTGAYDTAASPYAGVPSSSGLKAGFADDNEQFNYFLDFLQKFKGVPHREIPIDERIVLSVLDSAGKPVPDARVEVKAGGKVVDRGLTYSDGTINLYPSLYPADRYSAEASAAAGTTVVEILRDGPRHVTARLPSKRTVPSPVPIDVLFILDTTGSMSEEIASLRDSIEIINANLSTLKPKPAIRFGLVLYRDLKDEYVTKKVDFTSDLAAYKKELAKVGAGGGGDIPENLEAALEVSVEKMSWSPVGVRLAFVITDASAHVDYGNAYTYEKAARRARELGIKIYTIGTGGLDTEGEYQLRQISQLTQAKYIFLTYGERGDSAGGATASVSHHVGNNFVSDKLEVVVIRFAKEEYARYADQPVETDDSFFKADKIDSETREQTLEKLFTEALRNLSDYSGYKLAPDTKCAVMPVIPAAGMTGLESNAEYFSTNLLLAAAKAKLFTVVERKDLQKLLEEQELQLSGMVDEETAARIGKLFGATVMIVGELYRTEERYEIYLKLLRVETAEVLSVAKLKIDPRLGL